MFKTKTDVKERRAVSRRLATVLAGGLVLAFGAVATVASWHDSETTTATFSRSNPGASQDRIGFGGPMFAAGLTTP